MSFKLKHRKNNKLSPRVRESLLLYAQKFVVEKASKKAQKGTNLIIILFIK